MFLNLLLPKETSISLYDTIIWGILKHPCLWFSGLKYCIIQNINAKKKTLRLWSSAKYVSSELKIQTENMICKQINSSKGFHQQIS